MSLDVNPIGCNANFQPRIYSKYRFLMKLLSTGLKIARVRHYKKNIYIYNTEIEYSTQQHHLAATLKMQTKYDMV